MKEHFIKYFWVYVFLAFIPVDLYVLKSTTLAVLSGLFAASELLISVTK